MGTALTERQVRLLRRSAGEIVLALDADAAGRDAAIRGHDVVRDALQNSGKAVPVVSWDGSRRLPADGGRRNCKWLSCPTDATRTTSSGSTPEDWRALVERAVPVLDFRLDALVAATRPVNAVRAGRSSCRSFLPMLGAVTDPVVRAHYLQRVGRLSRTGERELSAMLSSAGRRRNSARSARHKLAPSLDQYRRWRCQGGVLARATAALSCACATRALDTPEELLL